MPDRTLGDAIFDALVEMEQSGRMAARIASRIARQQARAEAAQSPQERRDGACRCGCGQRSDTDRRGLAYACWKAAVAAGTIDTLYPSRRSRGNPLEWRGRQDADD